MIKLLDRFVADKIAAGEVIERPVSIVKELIENSIDAGADSVIVEIRNGGKTYIRVTDDGSGIRSDELELAFERHATSKLNTLEDLGRIDSLGFRGEALASIAAVSRLTVYSRTNYSASGKKLVMHGGRTVLAETAGTNTGTTMVVEDLFYNVPARRKFMGSDAREASAIIDLVEQYAIYYSNIRFMLVNNGSTVLTTEGNGDNLIAIKSINPTHEYDNLIHVNTDKVKGYISNPSITKSSRRGQLFFVNGRLVKSIVIEKGIEKGYGQRIFSGYPIAILFLRVDPASIDVNIHPGKKEIKFLNSDVVISDIAEAIESALRNEAPVPKTSAKATYSGYTVEKVQQLDYEAFIREESEQRPDAKLHENSDIRDYLFARIETEAQDESEKKEDMKAETETKPETETVEASDASLYIPEIPTSEPFSFAGLELKGYVLNTYIIMQKKEDIYLFDQHAAHERIFYEKLVSEFRNTEKIPQPVITPIVLNVRADVYAGDRNWMPALAQIGFEINDFGNNSFIIRGIPTYMSVDEARSFADAFIENSDEYSDNTTVIDKLITKSCKAAVKANEKLSTLEINDLMKALAECRNPYSCPHGRPTFVKVSKYELEKLFRRK
ncbi:MAG: DNA mismatch repair endonuclease MutL [Clostridiales bacterium]|nr:DNA mismatch repair endonuclease MutL [Candidatus Crickella caballi]